MKINLLNLRTGTIKVLFGTLIVVVIIFFGSLIYYDNLNSTEDPRVLEAKQLLLKYEKGLESDQYVEALLLLETMLAIYKRTPGYEESYEVGMVMNNQASVYLVKLETDLLTLEKSQIDRQEMVETLDMAMELVLEATKIYKNWIKNMGALSETEIRGKLAQTFDPKNKAFIDVDFEAVFEKRVSDTQLAQVETERRLSVALTNLGVINRYQGDLEEAKINYEQALNLWERNYTAKNNLNILMNLPLEKRSMIDRFFPPERLKELRAELNIKKPKKDFE